MISNKINLRAFIHYKFYNAIFTGLSVGSIFTLYAPLDPSIYPLGGVALALTTLFIAKMYTHILNPRYFFRISLLVELMMLVLVSYFLLFSYSYTTALFIYIGYQLTFSFGSYLVRAETFLIPQKQLLTFLDVTKQKGYLVGMALSYLFYKALEQFYNIHTAQEQVYLLHFLLFLSELLTIAYLTKAFK